MNAVEFLSNHRVVVNRQARGAPLPHLTDSAVKTTLSELNKGIPYNTIPWRGRGGGMPTHSGVEFERQLDKISIWLEGWNHTQVNHYLYFPLFSFNWQFLANLSNICHLSFLALNSHNSSRETYLSREESESIFFFLKLGSHSFFTQESFRTSH